MGLASKSITDICFSTIVFKCKPNSLIKMKKMCMFPYINEMAKVGKQEELWDLTNQQHPNSSPSVTCIRGHGRAPEEEGTVSAQRVPAIYHRSDFYARSPAMLSHSRNPHWLQILDHLLHSTVFIAKTKGVMVFTLYTPLPKVLIKPLGGPPVSCAPTDNL